MKPTNAMLVALLALVLVGGCGKKKTEDGAAPAGAEGAAVPPAPPGLTADDVATPEPGTVAEEQTIDEAMPPIDEGGSEPKVLARGPINAISSEVPVTGEMSLYDDGFGTRLLRIENLRSPSGFSMEVAFVPSAKPTTHLDLKSRIVVGTIKAPNGNMNFLIGREVDLKGMKSIALYQPGTPPQVLANVLIALPQKP